MSDQFIGEIRIFGGNSVPTGWLPCNGQFLPVKPYGALFSLLGYTYGLGDGGNSFAVPNLQARVPLHFGQFPYALGTVGGESTITLLPAELATHGHIANADNNGGEQGSPQNAVWGVQNRNSEAAYYSGPANAPMNPESIELIGGNQPHNNLPPYLVLNFCIAYQGIFPQRLTGETQSVGTATPT